MSSSGRRIAIPRERSKAVEKQLRRAVKEMDVQSFLDPSIRDIVTRFGKYLYNFIRKALLSSPPRMDLLDELIQSGIISPNQITDNLIYLGMFQDAENYIQNGYLPTESSEQMAALKGDINALNFLVQHGVRPTQRGVNITLNLKSSKTPSDTEEKIAVLEWYKQHGLLPRRASAHLLNPEVAEWVIQNNISVYVDEKAIKEEYVDVLRIVLPKAIIDPRYFRKIINEYDYEAIQTLHDAGYQFEPFFLQKILHQAIERLDIRPILNIVDRSIVSGSSYIDEFIQKALTSSRMDLIQSLFESGVATGSQITNNLISLGMFSDAENYIQNGYPPNEDAEILAAFEGNLDALNFLVQRGIEPTETGAENVLASKLFEKVPNGADIQIQILEWYKQRGILPYQNEEIDVSALNPKLADWVIQNNISVYVDRNSFNRDMIETLRIVLPTAHVNTHHIYDAIAEEDYDSLDALALAGYQFPPEMGLHFAA